MDQRIEFAMRAVNCPNFAELCREYGISRKTGYKWRERLLEKGLSGMEEESRRPRSHAHELTEDVVCEIVRLKQAHLHWGPRKIRELYARKHHGEAPSESSFKRVLERAGLTRPRRCRKAREGGRVHSGRIASSPNEVWTVDFKGWWRDRSGQRVEPLTVRDEFSRMVLEFRDLTDARTETVRASFERLFEAHGLPGAIRSDNGPPFASNNGLLGLSRLSVWWLALGIDLERGRPGHPQDNGAHERLHLDIFRELESGRAGGDQEAFDLWRHEFNNERPHEALGMKTPAELYRPSGRPYLGSPEEIDYQGMATRKVAASGMIHHLGELIFLSQALAGWQVGLAPRDDNGLVEVRFAHLLLGHIDPDTSAFKAAATTTGANAAQITSHDQL
jgi:transposase InsO family protein